MFSKKIQAMASLLFIASALLAACTPVAATPEVIVQTQIVTVAGTETVKEVVITATPGAVEPTAAPEKDKVLHINIGTYPDVIDPQKSSFVIEITTLKMIYEGLTKLDHDLNTVPGSAESWTYNDTATELTFQVRDGLTYSDGSLLNAKRFEYAIQRNVNPETAGEYASITDEILGAPEWRGCDAATEGACEATAAVVAESVKATHADGAACVDYEDADCNTLTITLSKAAPYFHTILGIWVAYPAKQENIEEGGENWWNSSKYQIGNGPYVMTTVEPFVRQYFVPNANYWDAKGQVDVEYSYITDTAVAFEAYKNNEFDMIASAAEDLDAIVSDATLSAEHQQYPGSCTTVIKMGLAGKYTTPDGTEFDSPFLDKKVREAFAYGFNAAGWAADVDGGLSSPTQTWIPPGFPGYDADETRYAFDPEAAKKALAESTYGGPEALNALGLKLTFGDTARNRVRSEWLVANYREVLGVDIALDPIETTTFTAITKDPTTFPLLARQGWCADYPDPQNWLSVYWKSDTSFASRQGYVNADFDALVAQADVELDPVKRAELYAEAQKLLISDVPSAFGYNNTNHYLVKPWVTGIVQTPQDADWAGSYFPTEIDIDTSLIP